MAGNTNIGVQRAAARARGVSRAMSVAAPLPAPDGAVMRPHLLHRLDAATEKRLTLVVAPPGYGKSVLLQQWALRPQARRVVWVAPADGNDATDVAMRLGEAMALADGHDSTLLIEQAEAGGRRMGPAFMPALLARAAKVPPVTMVIEDFQTVGNASLLAELVTFIEMAPAHMHFVVASRRDAPFPSHRFRLHDQVTDLRQRDLEFSWEHARELIEKTAHRPIASEHVDALLASTEGWAAALQLAAISLSRERDHAQFVDDFAKPHHNVTEYLTELVIKEQPEHVQQFLFHTAVLDRLNPGLCNAVTGRNDGHATLVRLERESLFVQRADSSGEWFRYHPLFRAFLLQQLRDFGDIPASELLQRAATWYFAHDDVEKAVSCLITAEAWSDVLRASQQHAFLMHERGRAAVSARWIDSVPAAMRSDRTDIALLQAGMFAACGDVLRVDSALEALNSVAPLSHEDAVVANLVRTWTVHNRSDPTQIAIAAENVLLAADEIDINRLPDGMGFTSPKAIKKSALVGRGAAAMYAGDTWAARWFFDAARRVTSDLSDVDVGVSSQLAMLDAWDGRLRSARRHGGLVASHVSRLQMAVNPSLAIAELALAHVARQRNELADAEAVLNDAFVSLAPTRPVALMGIWTVERALLALATGEFDEGLQLVSDVESGTLSHLPWAVSMRLRIAEARLLAMAGRPAEAQRVLETLDPGEAEVNALTARLAIDRGDYGGARSVLSAGARPGVKPSFEQKLLGCVLDDLDGGAQKAAARLTYLVSLAREEGDVRLFLDAGQSPLRLLRHLAGSTPSPFLRRVIDASPPFGVAVRRSSSELIEQLSERERETLSYLPSRLSNAEIAQELGVSINTLKTHLKHIYRKLEVDGRREAVARAEHVHLL